MEPRTLLGYALLAVILLVCTWGWRRLTREGRQERRAHRRGIRFRRERREQRLREEQKA